nr:hypothetical protein [Lentzea indica]
MTTARRQPGPPTNSRTCCRVRGKAVITPGSAYLGSCAHSTTAEGAVRRTAAASASIGNAAPS